MIIQAREEGGLDHDGLGRAGKRGRTGIRFEGTADKTCWLTGCKVRAKWSSHVFVLSNWKNCCQLLRWKIPGSLGGSVSWTFNF